MGGIEHIETVYSAAWVGWIMLLLALSAVLSKFVRPGMAIFRVGTTALAVGLCMDSLSLMTYGLVIALVVGLIMVKMLCNVLLDFVFNLRVQTKGVLDEYRNWATYACMLLYAAILVLLQVGNTEINRWVVASCAALFVGIITVRLAKVYLQNLLSAVYIGIYVLTLEVLPIGALAVLIAKMIN